MISGLRVLMMIRKNLLYFRKRVNKKSLDEMSSDIKISRDTLYRLENNGETDKNLYPNLKTIIAIADYFNIDVGEFLSRDIELERLERLETIDRLERLGSAIGDMYDSVSEEDNIEVPI